jgi:hypothetical protein
MSFQLLPQSILKIGMFEAMTQSTNSVNCGLPIGVLRQIFGDEFIFPACHVQLERRAWVFTNPQVFGGYHFLFWYSMTEKDGVKFYITVIDPQGRAINENPTLQFKGFLTTVFAKPLEKFEPATVPVKNHFSLTHRGDRSAEIRFQAEPKLIHKIISDVQDTAFMYDAKIKVGKVCGFTQIEVEGKTDYGVEKICKLVKGKL